MSLLSDLSQTLTPLGYPFETGAFTGKAPKAYIVFLPLSDTYDVHADNLPSVDIQEVRISLFTKGSYSAMKNKVISALLKKGLTITGRQYIGFETDTGYHHYNVDVAHYYEMED